MSGQYRDCLYHITIYAEREGTQDIHCQTEATRNISCWTDLTTVNFCEFHYQLVSRLMDADDKK